MFGLSTKEVLSKAILNSSANHIEQYKESIKNNFISLNNASEEESQKMLMSIRKDYLDEVSNSVINSFQVSSPKIAARIQLAMMSPSLCGYDDMNFDNGMIAGTLYAVCYYAITNKTASPKDCIYLNHLQNDIMENALAELDKELSV